MTFTGIDYTFLTNINPDKVEVIFTKYVKSYWENSIIENFDREVDHIVLFFAKNDAMNQFHDQNGYSLNAEGEGCFMLCARSFSTFHSDAEIFNITIPGDMGNIDRYHSKLHFHNLWEYTLVLPALIEESSFANTIHAYLIDAVSQKK